MNEAGDAVPGSQDSVTPGVQNLPLAVFQTTQLVPAVGASTTMPSTRRAAIPAAKNVPAMRPLWRRDPQAYDGYSEDTHEPEAWRSRLSRQKALCDTWIEERVWSVGPSDRAEEIEATTAEWTLRREIWWLATFFMIDDNLVSRKHHSDGTTNHRPPEAPQRAPPRDCNGRTSQSLGSVLPSLRGVAVRHSCLHRCRKLLAEISTGCDGNAELK